MEPSGTPTTLEAIARDERVRLLETERVGRLAFLVGAEIVSLPVNYAVDGDVVVFRTNPGAKLEGALLSRVASPPGCSAG